MLQSRSLREAFEDREKEFISAYGSRSAETRGRVQAEPPCTIRTAYQVDRDRIVYSNAFRRLKHKTQVFLTPMGSQYRTRLTHTLEVAQIARTIARAMRLNEDLTEAIALGHDLGHTPFGHGGETALKEIYSARFSHQAQGLRVVTVLERDGQGLNLTHEVRDGILKHSKGYGKIISDNPDEQACTIEGRIVRIADIMAYLNHDLDDAIRSGVIGIQQVPGFCTAILGQSHSERATTMIKDLVHSSFEANGELHLRMSDDVYAAMTALREFLYHHVYRSPSVHNEFLKAKKMLSDLYHYYMQQPAALQDELDKMGLGKCHSEDQPLQPRVCDFLASLTDSRAMALFQKLFIPSPMAIME